MITVLAMALERTPEAGAAKVLGGLLLLGLLIAIFGRR